VYLGFSEIPEVHGKIGLGVTQNVCTFLIIRPKI